MSYVICLKQIFNLFVISDHFHDECLSHQFPSSDFRMLILPKM